MLRGYVAIIASMLIWGSVGVFARKAGQEPLVTVTVRLLFGSLTLGLIVAMQGGLRSLLPADWRRRGLMVLSGLALALNWLFFFKAMDVTTVSNAVLSYYAAPVMVALASPFLLKERLEGRTLVATALAFGGIVVMLYNPGQGLGATDLKGVGFGLLAACFYALVTIIARWLADVSAARLVLVQCVTAALVTTPAVLWSGGPAALAMPLGALGLLAVVGMVHTALALFLYFWGLGSVKVQHVGVLAYLDPVSALLFAYLFLGEVPTPASLLGGAMVLGGSALLLRKSK